MISVVFVSVILVLLLTVVNGTDEPTLMPSFQPIIAPTIQPTIQPTVQPTVPPTVQPTINPTVHPTINPTVNPTIKPTPVPTVQPSRQPTSQPSSHPSHQPTSQPTNQPTKQPMALPTSQPSVSPTSQPSAQPSTQPTSIPTTPTSQPSSKPSGQPSRQPTSTPSTQPTSHPSTQPTSMPTAQPTMQPQSAPTSMPSSQPSVNPSSQPSIQPSTQPSRQPSAQPSQQPSAQPSTQPSRRPSSQPSSQPSAHPSAQPSSQPSSQPTSPTSIPTNQPSSQPSAVPSVQPTSVPTSIPTLTPPCPAGSSFDRTGHTVPGDPISGYYICTLCTAGTYTDEAKQDDCKICPAGSFSLEGATGCTLCPINSYAVNNGTAECTQCLSGEVNGLPGSKLASDCMNPAINFIMGSAAFLAAFFAIIVYMWFGRLHRIAFQRKFRLIRKLIMMYGTVLTTADMITRATELLNKLKSASNDRNTVKDRVGKPLLFIIVCVFVIPSVTFLYIVQSSIQITFNAMVLWRAYKRFENVDFRIDFLDPFYREIGRVIDSNEVIYTLSYPIVYVIDKISDININLNAVKITCPGAQTPLYLLTDMIIVAIVIMVIESDVHVFWTMMIEPAVSKIRSMIFSPQYFRRNWCATITQLSTAMLVTQIPGPHKLIQYCMGFVIMRSFFNFRDDGKNWVNRSDNCDGAVDFPIDSILANLSGVFAIIVLPAVVYLLSVVLFAVKNDDPPPSHTGAGLMANSTAVSKDGTPSATTSAADGAPHSAAGTTAAAGGSPSQACDPAHTTPHSAAAAGTENPSSTQPQQQQETEANHSGSSPDAAESTDSSDDESVLEGRDYRDTDADVEEGIGLTINTTSSFDDTAPQRSYSSHFGDGKGSARSRYSRQASSPLSPGARYTNTLSQDKNFNTISSKREGLDHLHTEEREEEWFSRATLSKILRAVSSVVALDWMLFTGIYYLGVFVFHSQRSFLKSKYMVHTTYRTERFVPDSGSKKVKVYVDAFTYDKDLYKLRKYVCNAKVSKLPLCDGFVTEDNAESIADRQREDKEWETEKKTLPSYYEMAQQVHRDMKASTVMETYFPYTCNILCHVFLTQFLTTSGRKNWFRVLQTYFGMLLICVGIWPEWLVKDFKIVDKFDEFNRLNEAIYRQIGDRVFTKRVEDAFTKIDNDETLAFGQFIAAITTCRIALLQVAPSLTAWSLFASAVASTPLLVHPSMACKLPPLLDTNAYEHAHSLLLADYKKQPSRLQVSFLTYYIFINRSRLIQFCINAELNIVAIVIIFFPQQLKFLVPIMLFIMTHQGLLNSVYVVMLFKKLLFPVVTEDTVAAATTVSAADDDDRVQRDAAVLDPMAPDQDVVTPGDIELMHCKNTQSTDNNNTGADGSSGGNGSGGTTDRPISRFSMQRGESLRMEELRTQRRQPGSSKYSSNKYSSSKYSSMHSMGSMQSMDSGDGEQPLPVQGSLWRRSSAMGSAEWFPLSHSASDNNINTAGSRSPSERASPRSGPNTPLSIGQMRAFPM